MSTSAESQSAQNQDNLANKEGPAVTLKASLAPLTTLSFATDSLAAIGASLAARKTDAPALFNNLPCVIDLTGLDPAVTSLADLHSLCRDNGLLPIAVRNVSAEWQDQLAALGLADLGKGNTRRGGSKAPAPEPEMPPSRAIKVHTGNIRSGQQFYFDGDLVIQGMVSAGAEVLATGDIHVYGALRGRVLAGIKGDETAIVGCQQFDGELVAIAGHYRLFDSDNPYQGQALLIRLDEGTLNISTLS